MQLSGPDGKPLAKPVSEARRMPSRQEKFNMVWMMFTLMTREERRECRKSLKTLQPKLDLSYPNGMSEGDMQRDIEKAASSIVPDPINDAKPEDTEIGAEQSVPAQPEADKSGEETAQGGAL